MKLVCMPVTITDWCSLHCYLPLQQVPSQKTYKKHQNVISGQKLRLLLIRGFKESPLLKQRQFRRDRKGRRERKGGKIAVIASQVKMTSFYCSYFVKGRIFSPFFYCSDFENTVVDSVHLFFFAFPSSNFCVDQKPHKKLLQ